MDGGLGMILIREATKKDAQQIMEHTKKITGTSKFMVMLSEELNQDLKEEQKRIEQQIQAGGLILLAEDKRKIIGLLSLRAEKIKRLKHVATMAIDIQEEYCNQGIGTKLLSYMIDWTKKNSQIEKICLHVLSSNERAIHVYKKIGFVEEGRRVDHIKMTNDCYVDDVLMHLKV